MTADPEAGLVTALAEWNQHRARISDAYEADDIASATSLEEAEHDYLVTVADAAEALLAPTAEANISSWTERHIAAGVLSPAARRMAPADAAAQHNETNALSPGDVDFLVAPGQVLLDLRITNVYAGRQSTRDVTVVVDAPPDEALGDDGDDDKFDDWACGQLLQFTGEGRAANSETGGYYVEILAAPNAYTTLVGREVAAEG